MAELSKDSLKWLSDMFVSFLPPFQGIAKCVFFVQFSVPI